MCGIVGYSGNSSAKEPIIEGLTRLEYRGYDSAGISLELNGELVIVKEKGKLANLKALLQDGKYTKPTIGIGHTRWATHGEVNQINAHPHSFENISIVHNGIVENASSLREELKNKGYGFKSETDTETFLIKLVDEQKLQSNFAEAIISAFKAVEGNSAFVIMRKGDHRLYSIKRSAPLVCGVNESSGEVYVSSDPYALVGYTSKIYFPEDEVLCIGDHHKPTQRYQFLELDLKVSKRFTIQKKEMELGIVDKGNYEHFMLKEIFEQPELILKFNSIYSTSEIQSKFSKLAKTQPSFLNIIGCGTALHAGMLIKYFLEKDNSFKVQTDFASEFRYKHLNLSKEEVGLFISQSGETADTLACQELLIERGIKTHSIVNVEGSTLYRNSDENLLLHAGVEVGVASTKAFTQMVLAGYFYSKSFGEKLNKDSLTKELNALSKAIRLILDREDEIKKIAREIYQYKGFIFTGRREQFPIALEGALKLKEIAYVHAEGYAAGELKHGPIALFDENMVNIALIPSELYEKTLSNAQEVKARRGVMVIVGEGSNEELENLADFYFGVDFTEVQDLKPVVTNVVLQLLSYHIAKFKGTDIDKPRNLAKSVTVE